MIRAKAAESAMNSEMAGHLKDVKESSHALMPVNKTTLEEPATPSKTGVNCRVFQGAQGGAPHTEKHNFSIFKVHSTV